MNTGLPATNRPPRLLPCGHPPRRQSRPGDGALLRKPATGAQRTAVRYVPRMSRESGAAVRTAGADPAGAWVKEWRRLLPPPGIWWRKSTFDLAKARRRKRLRPWRWLTDPAATFRIWLATRRLSPAARARWNRRAEAAAAVDPLLSALDPHQRRAAACFEDRAMVTAGAGSGKTPDDGGAGGLRRPPARHAARGDRLHHFHEQGHRGDPATDARTPTGPPGGHDPPARAPGAEARRRPHRPALADGGGRRPEAAGGSQAGSARRSTATRGSPPTSNCAGTRAVPR